MVEIMENCNRLFCVSVLVFLVSLQSLQVYAAPCYPPQYCTGGDMLGDPDDCTIYWYCVHAVYQLRNCPATLEFSASRKICDWPSNECQGPCPTTESYTGPTISPGPCPGDAEICRDDPMADGENFAHATDCASYYLCRIRVLVPERCVQTYDVFDIVLRVCTQKTADIDCSYEGRCPPTPTTEAQTTTIETTILATRAASTAGTTTETSPSENSTITIHTTTVSTVQPTTLTESPVDTTKIASALTTTVLDTTTTTALSTITPGPCNAPTNCQDGDSLGDPDDCRIVWTCVNGQYVSKLCSDGREFDTLTKQCVPPGTGQCQGPCNIVFITTAGHLPTAGAAPEGLCDYSIFTNCDAGYLETETFAYKFDCAKYYLCQGRILHMRTCPGSDVYIVQTRTCGIKTADFDCSESGRCQTGKKAPSLMLINYLKSLKINNN